MGTLTTTISGTAVAVLEGSIKTHDTLDQASTLSFAVLDSFGSVVYQPGQQVSITDSVLGLIYAGYIHTAKKRNVTPNTTNIIDIDCIDQHYLADKTYSRKDYQSQYAGDIAADLLSNYLIGNGVMAAYAVRRDATATQLALGTTSNVVGATTIGDGDLELKPAGTTTTIIETSTADFATGTLTNTVATNNTLALTPLTALRMKATSQQGANNNYVYLKIWAGSVALVTGDSLVFTQWVSSTSPAITGGLDITCSDGTNLRDQGANDQVGLIVNPGADLSGYANDQWFTRTIGLTNIWGKTATYVCIAQEGDANGEYTFYIANAKIVDSTGTTKATIFSNALTRTPTQLSDTGFSNVSLTVVTGYQTTGTRFSPSYSLSSLGIVRNSIVSWTQAVNAVAVANDAKGPNKIPYSTVQSSIDGGTTWQACTNHGAIPNLYAGASTSGLSVIFKETLQIAGPDPTIAPVFNDFTATILPSYLTSISNIQSKYNSTNWTSAGTHSNTMTGLYGDLQLNGDYRNWRTDTAPTANITLFGGSPNVGVGQPNSALAVRCDAATDVRARLDDAGSWGDCVIEVDVFLGDTVGNYGIEYATTSWNSTLNTYAYNAYINSTQVLLSKGSNGGSGSFTILSSVTIPLAVSNWYHLKVQHTGTNHKVFVNDVQYINLTDSTYTSPGGIALRHYNGNASGGARHNGYFQSFGVQQSQTGQWISNGVSLSSLGTFGPNLIQWNDDTAINAILLIESSIDNGTTYATCTNNAALPGIVAGASASGKTLKLRVSLTTQNANVTPNLHGISVLITSAFSVSGSRISPALSLNGVGAAGSTSISWNALVPTNTALLIDTSLDGTTWTNVGSGALGSAPIAGITTQADPIDDTFDSNTASSYTGSSRTGGTFAAWTWNVLQSRLEAVGGTNALLFLNAISGSTTDVSITFDMDYADQAGVFLRYQNSNSYYYCEICDSNASSNANTSIIKKWSFGTAYNLDIYRPISFTRSTPHRFVFSVVGNTLTLTMDGTQVSTYTDSSSPIANGQVGLQNASGSARFYQFRVQPLGQSVSGLLVYSRARLSSTDPTVSPQLEDLTLSVRGPSIQTGALIPQTQYSVLSGSKNTVAQDLDDLAKQSNFVCKIDKNKQLWFVSRSGMPSPWIATPSDMQVANLSLEIASDQYRNMQIITGGKDVLLLPEQKQGDGITQSWTLGYPVDSVTSISVNGVIQTFGVKGVDTGRSFYYEQGSNVLIQDASLTPLDTTQLIMINYQGQVNVTVEARNDAQIAWLAGTDGTDGIVAVTEDCSGLNKLAMLQLAYARLQQFAVLGRTLTFTTMRSGLATGQVLSVFLPQFGINDGQFLISDVATNYITTSANNIVIQQPFYSITCTDGPIIPSYAKFLSNFIQA